MIVSDYKAMKPLIALLVLFIAWQAESQELTSTLHTTLYGVQVAYTDELVVFTCVLRGSNNLVWTSDEYIGARQQLSLVSVQPEGHEVRAIGNDQTVAVLVNATTDVIIISELRIRVVSTYPIASVQCVNGASTNTMTSTLFRLADLASVTCDRQSVCPSETVTCTCATGNSNALAWMSNGTRLLFTSNDPLPTRRNVPGSSTFAVLIENSEVNGIRVIMSNLTLSVSSNDPEIILTCDNVDRAMIEPIIVPTTRNCPMDPSDTTPTGNDNSGSCAGPITTAVVPVIIVTVSVLIMTTIGVVIFFYLIKYKPLQKRFSEKVIEYSDKVRETEKLEISMKEKDKEMNILRQTKEREMEDLKASMKEMNKQLKDKLEKLQAQEKQRGANERKLVDLQAQVVEKDGALKSLQTHADESKKELAMLKSQMDKEKEKVEEFKKAMKEKLKKELTALEDKMKMVIEQASEKGTSVEKEEAAKNAKQTEDLKAKIVTEIGITLTALEGNMDKEVKKVTEIKRGTWSRFNPFK